MQVSNCSSRKMTSVYFANPLLSFSNKAPACSFTVSFRFSGTGQPRESPYINTLFAELNAAREK